MNEPREVWVEIDTSSPEAQAEAKRAAERFKVAHQASLEHLERIRRERERWWW